MTDNCLEEITPVMASHKLTLYQEVSYLCSFAWENYLQHGRGVLLITFEKRPDADGLTPTPFDSVEYVTLAEFEANGWQSNDMKEMKEYNPEKEMLCFARVPDDNTLYDYPFSIQANRTMADLHRERLQQ